MAGKQGTVYFECKCLWWITVLGEELGVEKVRITFSKGNVKCKVLSKATRSEIT